jgi:hypothetical protein
VGGLFPGGGGGAASSRGAGVTEAAFGLVVVNGILPSPLFTIDDDRKAFDAQLRATLESGESRIVVRRARLDVERLQREKKEVRVNNEKKKKKKK